MSGPITNARGQIIKPQTQTASSDGGIIKLLESMKGEIARVMADTMKADRMARIVLTAIRTTPKLTQCTPMSFAGCVMSLAQLDLEPNTLLEHAWLIPRNNSKRQCVECTTIIGYQGEIELARRSGLVKSIEARIVREGDDFDYAYGLNPTLVHRPSRAAGRQQRPIIYTYAVCRIKDADPIFEVLSIEQVEERRCNSPATSDGPWITHYEAMVRKTGVRAIWPFVPKSTKQMVAAQLDAAADRGISQVVAWDDGVRSALLQQGLNVEEEERAATAATTPEKQEPPAAEAPQTQQPRATRQRAKKPEVVEQPPAAQSPAAQSKPEPEIKAAERDEDPAWQDKLGRLGVIPGAVANDGRQGALPLVEDQPPRREPGDDSHEEES